MNDMNLAGDAAAMAPHAFHGAINVRGNPAQ
jgi:hypothetical protein